MPVKPVTKEEIYRNAWAKWANDTFVNDPKVKPEDCELTETNPALSAMDSWAALQTGERDERIKELENALKPFAVLFGELTESKVQQGGIVFQFNAATITVSDLLTVSVLLNRPNGV